jgi:hypothetical protein
VRRKWLIRGGAIALIVTALLFAIAARTLSRDSLTARVTAAMAAALNCDVSMDPLKVQLLPRIKVSGSSLTIRLKSRPDLPPFIAVDQFDVNLGLLSVIRRHIEEVHLDGLHVNVPPRVGDIIATSAADTKRAAPETKRMLFHVDHIVTHDAIVNFVAKKAEGRPLAFDVHNLDLADAGVEEPMTFSADLTNPVPAGQIYSRGKFGPWNRDDPTLTLLSGAYTLADADLNTINGISGKTVSAGTFKGVLTDIEASGQSETPNFSLDLGGKPVPLSTTFTVTVDGTNGTTKLNNVEAHLAGTTILVTGLITNLPGPHNHDVELGAEVRDGHIEDLMRLVIDSPKPLVTGKVTLSATLKLPPGDGPARRRISAGGVVRLNGARFTDADMNVKIAELSRRGLGKKPGEITGNVAADFNGAFALDRGVVTLSKTQVQVPGAIIRIAGTYHLGSEEVDFEGEALLEATMSRAIGGFKSIFLKPFNPLFRKEGAGAVVPIRITGTRPSPQFGVRKAAIFGKDKN